MAQLPVPFAQYSDPRACTTVPLPHGEADAWMPASQGTEYRPGNGGQIRGKPKNGRPPLERLREAFEAHGVPCPNTQILCSFYKHARCIMRPVVPAPGTCACSSSIHACPHPHRALP